MKFMEPVMEVITVAVEDVITTSGTECGFDTPEVEA